MIVFKKNSPLSRLLVRGTAEEMLAKCVELHGGAVEASEDRLWAITHTRADGVVVTLATHSTFARDKAMRLIAQSMLLRAAVDSPKCRGQYRDVKPDLNL